MSPVDYVGSDLPMQLEGSRTQERSPSVDTASQDQGVSRKVAEMSEMK